MNHKMIISCFVGGNNKDLGSLDEIFEDPKIQKKFAPFQKLRVMYSFNK